MGCGIAFRVLVKGLGVRDHAVKLGEDIMDHVRIGVFIDCHTGRGMRYEDDYHAV